MTMIYIMAFHQFKDKKKNQQELYNEAYFYLCSLCFISFTDQYSLSYKIKNNLGYCLIGLLGL